MITSVFSNPLFILNWNCAEFFNEVSERRPSDNCGVKNTLLP
jgi:hypothetical protein